MVLAKEKIRFSWDIHWSCNYRCPYCWFNGNWEKLEAHNFHPDKEKLIAAWKRIYGLYGETHIEINGGEPFTYPDFPWFINELLQYHTARCMTNLSMDVKPLTEAISSGDAKRLIIGASFHPARVEIEPFIRRVMELKDAGIQVDATCVAYPPYIKSIPEYKKKFSARGIDFSVLTFWGNYMGKEYPASYTDEEKSIIRPEVGQRSGEKFQLEPLATKGRLCKAGSTYGAVHPDGQVVPCGGGSLNNKAVIIGNIFDENFSLRGSPMECISDNCPCNEWSFLQVK